MNEGTSDAKAQARIFRWAALLVTLSLVGLLLPSELYWVGGVLLVVFIMRLLPRRV